MSMRNAFQNDRLRTIFALLVLALTPAAGAQVALPDAPEEKGKAIAQETERRDQGFEDSRAAMVMILENANGETSERRLRQEILENTDPGKGDKSFIVFDEPRDVAGTALLTHAKILEPDDQWLFLPALKRIKRISSANKSGPFLGSEFAYEDFSSAEVEKYAYRWLRDEACPGAVGERTCHVVERTPLYEGSGYSKQIVWSDVEDYQPRLIEFYNLRGDLLKTLTLSDYTLYLERHWRAHDLYMVNHLTKKKTRLVWETFEFKTGLGERDFSQNRLRRAR